MKNDNNNVPENLSPEAPRVDDRTTVRDPHVLLQSDDTRLLVQLDQRGRQLGALAEFREAVAHVTQADYADGKEEWHAWCPPDDVHDAESVGVGADKEDIPF